MEGAIVFGQPGAGDAFAAMLSSRPDSVDRPLVRKMSLGDSLAELNAAASSKGTKACVITCVEVTLTSQVSLNICLMGI